MALAVLATAGAAQADEGFKISGDFAASYFLESGAGGNNPGLVNHDNIQVDQVELNIEKMMGNSSIHMGIMYGAVNSGFNAITDSVTGAGSGAGNIKNTLNLTNAYFAHNFDFGLGLKVGRMATFMGSEDYHMMNNNNYNFSYGFTNLVPKFLTGLALDYNVNDMVNVALYAVNTAGTVTGSADANSDGDGNKNTSFGLSVGVTAVENLVLKVNYLTGKEGPTTALGKQDIMELVAKYTMDAFNFGLDYTSRSFELDATGSEKQTTNSIAGYVGWAQEGYGASLRYEMFDDPDGIVTNGGTVGTKNSARDNDLSVITISGYYDMDTNARLKLEVAQTSSDKKIFVDGDGAADDSNTYYGAALMYRF